MMLAEMPQDFWLLCLMCACCSCAMPLVPMLSVLWQADMLHHNQNIPRLASHPVRQKPGGLSVHCHCRVGQTSTFQQVTVKAYKQQSWYE